MEVRHPSANKINLDTSFTFGLATHKYIFTCAGIKERERETERDSSVENARNRASTVEKVAKVRESNE